MSGIDPGDAVRQRSFIVLQTGQGDPYAFGRVISYTDVPTFTVELADGKQFSWRADLCRSASLAEVEQALKLAWDER